MRDEYNWPNFGRAAFEAYWKESGEPPITWGDLNETSQRAWIECAKTIIDIFSRTVLA